MRQKYRDTKSESRDVLIYRILTAFIALIKNSTENREKGRENEERGTLKRVDKNSNYLVSSEILNYAGENGFPSHRRGYIGYRLLEFGI